MVHNPAKSDSPEMASQSVFHLVSRKSGEHMYQRLGDPSPNFGLNRSPAHHFLLRLRDFPPHLKDLVVVASTASTDVGLFTRSEVPLTTDRSANEVTNVFTMTEMADDSRRAQLPVSEDMEDTSPIGAALDLSSTDRVPRPIPSDEMDASQTPLPGVLVLNNEGVLASWWVVYNDSVRQGTSFPGLAAVSAGQPSAPATQVSAFGASATKPAFGQSAFGASTHSNSAFGASIGGGGAFGSPAASKPAFGAPSFGAPAFGAPAASSPTVKPAFSAPAFGAPSFGSPAFGNTSTPAATGVAFGSSGLPGQRASPWGAAGTAATPAAFGQPSGLGAATQSAKPAAFGSSSAFSASASGGFASFAKAPGFGGISATPGTGESIFGAKPPSGGFAALSKPAETTSAFGSTSVLTGQSGSLLGSQSGSGPGFSLTSSFKPDTTSKDDNEKDAGGSGTSFFGGGFGKVLGGVKQADSEPSPEANMEDDSETVQQQRPSTTGFPRATASPLATAADASKPPASSLFPKPAAPAAQSTGPFGAQKPAIASPAITAPSKPTGFSFGNLSQPSQIAATKTPSLFSTTKAAEIKTSMPEAPLPPDQTNKATFGIGELSASSQSADAPLPPDFMPAPKAAAPKVAKEAPKSPQTAANDLPPVDIPDTDGEDGFNEFSDEDLEGDDEDKGEGHSQNEEDFENSGEDVAKDLSPAAGQTPESSPENSVSSRLLETKRPKQAAGTIGQPSQPAGRSLFGEIPSKGKPMFPVTSKEEARSPSPVRSAIPPHLRGRPDVSRSFSAPMAAAGILGSGAPPSKPAFKETLKHIEDEQLLRSQALKRKEVAEAQALIDEDDERTQEYLQSDIQPTIRLDEYIVHHDYVGDDDKDSVPYQVEAVFRDINLMIDNLGMNSRTLMSFIKGHTETCKEEGRTIDDLETADDWRLDEIEQISRIVEHDLKEELDQGRIVDPAGRLRECCDLARDAAKLRSRKDELSAVLSTALDPNHAALSRSQSLTAEQATYQHDLRKEFTKLQKLISEAEEGLVLLRTKLSSVAGAKGKGAPTPTVEAIIRTVTKMTAMAERRSGDIDVLENQMRRLRFNSVGRDSPARESSPFNSPTKSIMRLGNMSINERPYTPERNFSASRTFRTSFGASMRSQGYGTPPRKKLEGFTVDDRSRIKEKTLRRKEVIGMVKKALEKSGSRVYPMD